MSKEKKRKIPEVTVRRPRPGEIQYRPTAQEMFRRHWDEVKHTIPVNRGGRPERPENKAGRARALELFEQGYVKDNAALIAAEETGGNAKTIRNSLKGKTRTR